uniref:Uncharacterized protein n=1 Tax=Hucho hucho TaxID=62062 RepID=A0A4W5RVJ7_9TELE
MVTLSLLSLGLLSLLGVRGEVAPNFDNCKDSFFRKTPVSGLNIALPTPLERNTQDLENRAKCLSAYSAASPAYICQRNGNHYYFATLYDRGSRIPLYSAYEMDIEGLVHPDLIPQKMKKTGHHKGDASKATMTHINVAPQDRTMNNGPWNQYEKKLKDVLSVGCSKMYVVTGVVPSSMWVDQKKRVNVPSHYWNPYCCTDNNGNPLNSAGALNQQSLLLNNSFLLFNLHTLGNYL